jgi:hypothetical protein
MSRTFKLCCFASLTSSTKFAMSRTDALAGPVRPDDLTHDKGEQGFHSKTRGEALCRGELHPAAVIVETYLTVRLTMVRWVIFPSTPVKVSMKVP